MDAEPEFRGDLYRGTAPFYDEFRVPYPAALLDDLCRRTHATGAGRLLDLACGTGQLAFGLAARFAEVTAVDQEPEAIDLARANARARHVHNIRWTVGRAEDVEADNEFDLVVIGNAFHRLRRRRRRGGARLARPGWAPGPRVEPIAVGRRPGMAAGPRPDHAGLDRDRGGVGSGPGRPGPPSR